MDNVSKAQPEQHAYHPLSAQDTEQHLQELFSGEEKGYHKGLKNRQIQMIALGGAIGTGLFMGAGGRLATAGPSLMFVYLACGVISYLVLRALGELVLHRPSSGSFVSYAREFYGEKAAFVCGWVYWFGWAMAGIVDTTAVALYMNFFSKYWAPIASVPQWVFALIALVLILSMNLVSVKVFGELEFWFALIKVVALVAFLVIGAAFVIFGTPTDGHEVGFQLIANNGGLLPHGLLPAILIVSGVVFAFAGVELLGNAAGETENPEKVIPKAINTVIFRIAVFYVGSVLLLCLLLPYTAYQAGVSPFVTFFGSIGWDGIDAIMNMVVLTAALSSLNAGLYSTGRILHSMSYAGSAPKFASRMNAAGVPYSGIAAHRHRDASRRRSQRSRARQSVRDRPQRRRVRHAGLLGHARALPTQARAVVQAGHRAAARDLPDAGQSLHLLSRPRLPRRRLRPDRLRLPGRNVDSRLPSSVHPAPRRGLVRLPQPHPGDRRGTSGLHRRAPRSRQTATGREQGKRTN